MIVKQSELADILGVHYTNIYKKTKAGVLPHIKRDGCPVKYVLKEVMKVWYGEDHWESYYNKYIDQKINELESYRKED